MVKKYRQDKDLEFFKLADNDMLEVLVKYLTQDKDGDLRITEELTDNEVFKKANGNYHKVWEFIAAELQCFGGDSIVNAFRGHGVTYQEILSDVCDRLDVKYDSESSTIDNENLLIQQLFKKSWENMSEEERAQTISMLNIEQNVSQESAFTYIYQNIGKKDYLTYRITLGVATAFAQHMLGRVAGTTVAQFVIGRGASVFLGPVGILLAGLACLPLVSGPAYRVTVPAVVHIAMMRKQLLSNENGFF